MSRAGQAFPPGFFAIAFGIAGLAAAWRAAQPVVGVPGAVADGLFLVSAVTWAILMAGLARQLIRTPRAVLAELRDPVLSPFMALPALVALLLSAGLFPHAPTPAKVIALASLVVVGVLGGWLTGQWIAGAVDPARLHPAYFLPTVAGGFVGANVLGAMGYREIAWLSFGVGIVCWMQLGSVILQRLIVGPPLPSALVPTLAIEVAPPAVAGNAYFVLQRGADDALTYALAGFCVLSVLVQLRFVPVFRRLRFTPAFWAFAFSYASVAAFALNWLAHGDPDGARLLGWVTLTAITAFVGGIAVKSVQAVARGRFLPAVEPTSGQARVSAHRADVEVLTADRAVG